MAIKKVLTYGVTGIVALMTLSFVYGVVVGAEGEELSNCESGSAQEFLIETFDKSQYARLRELSAVLIEDAERTGEDHCNGVVVLNNGGKLDVLYSIKETKEGDYLLSFEEL